MSSLRGFRENIEHRLSNRSGLSLVLRRSGEPFSKRARMISFVDSGGTIIALSQVYERQLANPVHLSHVIMKTDARDLRGTLSLCLSFAPS